MHKWHELDLPVNFRVALETVWVAVSTRDPARCPHCPPGDIDGIVPLVGTRRWISGLGLRIKEPWRPYFSLTSTVPPPYDLVILQPLLHCCHLCVKRLGASVGYTVPHRFQTSITPYATADACSDGCEMP